MSEQNYEEEQLGFFLKLIEEEAEKAKKLKDTKTQKVLEENKSEALKIFVEAYRLGFKKVFKRIYTNLEPLSEVLSRSQFKLAFKRFEKSSDREDFLIYTNNLGFESGTIIGFFVRCISDTTFFSEYMSFLQSDAITIIERFANNLKEVGIKVKPRHIERIIKRTIKASKGNLTVEQKKFLAECAALFS